MSCFRKDPNFLRCRSCELSFALCVENFPDDLFQLLSKYDLPQIHWFCKSCDRWKITQKDIAELGSRLSKLEVDITAVKSKLSGEREIDVGPYYDEPPPEKKFRLRSVFNLSRTSRDSSPDERSLFARSHSSSPSSSSIRSSDRSPPSKDKEANSILNNIIFTGIKIKKDEASLGKQVITDFMEKLIPYLKNIDLVFKFMFKREYRTGSSYNDLKISSANEYDVNIMFGLTSPFRLEVEFFELTKVFAKLKWSKTEEINDASDVQKSTLKFLEKNSNKNGYLNPLDIRAWFQGLIDKFCHSNPQTKLIKKIINSQSGPARTIKICTTKNFQLSIDLVPVFEFQFSDVFNSENQIKRLEDYPLKPAKKFCTFIPKICVGEVQLLQSDCQLSWRLHVPELDKKVLNQQQFQCAKPIIRLLKLLRDKNNWQSLASYHLLTVVLWGIKECPDDYGNAFLYQRFLGALELLQGHLKDKFLPYFLCDDYNLFHNLNADQCTNLSNRIGNIIKKLGL